MLDSFKFKPIGIVHSPFKKREDIDPRRNADPKGFDTVCGEFEIFKEYEAGLKDIDGFSHLIVFFAFHEARGFKIRTVPPFDSKRRGVFATRSPQRPNPIGMTVVKLLERKRNILKVCGLDMLEGTPILDVKPYTAKDRKIRIKHGWIK